MFGIDDILLFSALGGGLGALTGKKPLQGALMGAGLGAAGGAFLPGLLGAGGAAAGGEAAATTAGMAGVPASVIPEGVAFTPATTSQMASMGVALGSGGLLGGLKAAGEYAKPIGQAAGAASTASSLLGSHRQPITPSPVQQPVYGGNQILAQLAQAPTPGMQQMQMAEQARQRRRMGLLGAA
jgi:hypothetical protein